MTIFRRREEFGLLDEPDRSLTDSELTAKVSEKTYYQMQERS